MQRGVFEIAPALRSRPSGPRGQGRNKLVNVRSKKKKRNNGTLACSAYGL
jgi:hypothetical protein